MLVSLAASWVIKVYWTLNILVSFLTGYLDHRGVVVMNPPKVAKRYLSTWFFFDLVVIFLDWGELAFHADEGDESVGSAGVLRVAGAISALRLLRIVRVVRLVRLAGIIVYNVRNERAVLIASIARLMILMIFITHLIACMWFAVGRHGRTDYNSWVKYYKLDGEPFSKRYLMSFHCALAMFTGEHIAHPRNAFERFFTVTVIFLTMVISAGFVSSLTTAMTRLHIITSRRSSQFAALRRYLADQCISRDLAAKVFRNAQHAINEQKRNAPESSIELLTLISEPLRSELHFEVYSPVLLVHPFFAAYKDFNLPGVYRMCHYAINRMTFSTGDIVFSENECPAVPKMFLVGRGSLEYVQHQASTDGHAEQTTVYVHASNWLSEAVLWTDWTHHGTLRATSECQLLTLDAMKFQSIVSKFPTNNVKIYAEEFVKMLSTTNYMDLTDVGVVRAEIEWALYIAFPSQTRHSLMSIRSRRSKSNLQDSVVPLARTPSGRVSVYSQSSHFSMNSLKSTTVASRIITFCWWLQDTACVRKVSGICHRLHNTLTGKREVPVPTVVTGTNSGVP